MGRCKPLGSLHSFLSYAPQLSKANPCFFLHLASSIPGSSAITMGVGGCVVAASPGSQFWEPSFFNLFFNWRITALQTFVLCQTSTWINRESEVAQSYPTLCHPMDCSLPGFSIHGIFQAKVPEWVAFSFSKGSSRPRDQTQISRITGRCFTLWATREAPHVNHRYTYIPSLLNLSPISLPILPL